MFLVDASLQFTKGSVCRLVNKFSRALLRCRPPRRFLGKEFNFNLKSSRLAGSSFRSLFSASLTIFIPARDGKKINKVSSPVFNLFRRVGSKAHRRSSDDVPPVYLYLFIFIISPDCFVFSSYFLCVFFVFFVFSCPGRRD